MYSLKNKLFLKKEEVFIYLKQFKLNVSEDFVNRLFDLRVIPVIFRGSDEEEQYILKENIEIVVKYLTNNSENDFEQLLSKLHLHDGEMFYTGDQYALLNNLFSISAHWGKDSEKISEHYKAYKKMKDFIINEKKSIFARSAYYMGSKVGLRTFLLESLSRIDIESHIFIDLMTGSGTVAGAFANYSRTLSSDAMNFSKYLSLVQGGGYTTERAMHTMELLKEKYLENYENLHVLYGTLMKEEESFLLSDDTKETADRYLEVLNNSYLYSSKYRDDDDRIKKRKENSNTFPYLLFTEYFANVYFGINQAIQIDSIRYAIDSIDNEIDKDWALGALIATCSHVASSHASHFAQPTVLIDKDNNIKYRNINKMLMKRRISVWREFEATFLSLADESKKTIKKIDFISGPWRNAVQWMNDNFNSKDVLFYVDAPYKREEYSRYYHVLETLVKYNYPSIFGKGRQPYKDTIKGGERFTSEFFTKSISKVETVFVELFFAILTSGWKCAWSYSNNGVVSIVSILEKVASMTNCSIISFSTPYKHKSQNKTKTKNVEEYLFLMIPKRQDAETKL